MLKKILFTLTIVLFSSTLALATWLTDIHTADENSNMQEIIKEALQKGAAPVEILKQGLKNAKINPQDLIAAMYLAGISDTEIKAAAKANGISEEIVLAAYKQAFGDNPDQAQPFTPIVPNTIPMKVLNITTFGTTELNRADTQQLSPSNP